MLIRYKKSFEKIAMGLLSFMPEVSDVKTLQEIIKEYDSNPDWNLFLWKEEDIIGAVGVRVEDGKAIIQHVSVNPSHRNAGIGKQMIHRVRDHFKGEREVCADIATESFIDKCDEESASSQL
ncbi:riboflavin biosynthesis RibT protein [Halobacillus karajensis]|uniref:Acetyltransferase (GNAT) family protein n=1 Tax=Halobacillus karajensis TaxID=195088 RepID=A0A024P1X4_9BACI|nr:GNAT family N-acetyltransferase [Halobacillus karajensis]CDQ19444.1 Acetyltransferase (GNAT) family protein [Halobacillus karajensis]CDQ21906.1 Acetyltransferase (GNAT) family protein [Halobacillus karajensis]CDQ27747.1 Acetyltransferase (GNAT) family protein [Halobacillus karajensis]SEH82396.1 riboflavin biosynthesis RibT protein [Halobacillus karajensis]